MTLLLFITGVLLVYLIARYNQSNKLFWTLFLAFVTGFAITKAVLSSHENTSKRNEVVLVQPSPMQMQNAAIYAVPSAPVEVTAPKSAGQVYDAGLIKDYLIPSEVFEEIRGQPQFTFFDTS